MPIKIYVVVRRLFGGLRPSWSFYVEQPESLLPGEELFIVETDIPETIPRLKGYAKRIK